MNYKNIDKGDSIVYQNDEIDKIAQFIGNKIYALRIEMGYSQKTLGKIVDVTAQQISKYEKGRNRITVVKLALIAKTLGVKMNYFFRGIKYINKQPLLPTQDNIRLELMQNFMRIKSRKQQEAIEQLIKAYVRDGSK